MTRAELLERAGWRELVVPRGPASIGPGAESVAVELWAADPGSGRWDRATWDGATWAGFAWQGVGCDVTEATYTWGARSEAGILSLAEAGELDLETYDPARELDPLNTASPYYGFAKPGTPVRLAGLAPDRRPAWTGYIDEVSFDLAASRGRIRAIDAIAYLAQAQIPDGTVLPATLRARTRAIVVACELGSIVAVEPESTDPDAAPDPPVAPFDGKSRPAWQAITEASIDALTYVWLDPSGILRFRAWSDLLDAGFSVGCKPADADPSDLWLAGLSTLTATASGDAIRNRVRAYTSGTTWSSPASDAVSVARYGPRPYDVERVVPGFGPWSTAILADRADAGLEATIGQLRPYSSAELAALLDAGIQGPSTIRVRDDEHGELVDLELGMIGAGVGVTPAGWRFGLVSMLSRVDWEAIAPKPPDPKPPDAGRPYHTETRTYVASSDALVALTSGGAKYGAGAASSLPVGAWQGWTYRSLIKLPSIPFGSSGAGQVKRLVSATLRVQSSTQVRVGFGSSPKCQLRRITGSWSAGTASSPSSSNAVVWPGPATSTSGAVTSSLPTAENAARAIRCDAIALAWAPAAIGGSGAAQQGIALYEASSSTSNTGEVWPLEQGGAARPALDLVVEVYDA